MDKISELTQQMETLTGKLWEASVELATSQELVTSLSDKPKNSAVVKQATVRLEQAVKARADLDSSMDAARTALYEEINKRDGHIATLTKKVGSLTKAIATKAEEDRQGKIDKGSDACKVPSFRNHFRALYEFATSSDRVVAFSENDEEREVSAIEVVDELVKAINSRADFLFGWESAGKIYDLKEVPKADNPSAEVDRLAAEHMGKTGEKDYSIAVNAVLEADPELRRLYSEFSSQTKH